MHVTRLVDDDGGDHARVREHLARVIVDDGRARPHLGDGVLRPDPARRKGLYSHHKRHHRRRESQQHV